MADNASMRRVQLSEEDLSRLVKVLSNADSCNITVSPELSGYWLHSPQYETELRLLFLPGQRITVSRVKLQKRHAGTMTHVFSILKEFAKKYGLPRIVIQSVVTHEMVCWCRKNGFTIDIFTAYDTGDDFLGDYYYEIPKI